MSKLAARTDVRLIEKALSYGSQMKVIDYGETNHLSYSGLLF